MSNEPQKPGQVPPSDFGELTDNVKNMAMLCHLLGAIFGVLGALIMWLIKKDEHPFINDQGKEALNFTLTMLLIIFATVIFGCVLTFLVPFAFLLYWLPWIAQLVMGIMAAMQAKEGVAYRYPFAIRLIK
ncbi:DUF4870 domain-containing protein [Vicingaceae bacterium]|nr:DUF4870 domain-containing protein [Vicingaceae bacterium]